MAKISDISINVGIAIDQETVNRCCNLLSIYMTDNPNKTIEISEWHDMDCIRRNVFIADKLEDEQ